MTAGRPIGENDLHAYVDQALDLARRAEVELYLGQHPDVAARVEGFVRQRADLRAALAPVAQEPVPARLSVARLTEPHRAANDNFWRSAAAAVLLLGLGGAGGWVLHVPGGGPEGGIAALGREAAASFATYAPDQVRPVELKASDSATLVNWVSRRLGHPVAVPDLSAAGYRLMGGRLVPTEHGPAGLFLYDNDKGSRLGVLVRPMSAQGDMPMSEQSNGPVSGYAWADKGIGYSLVSDASSGTLHPLADEVRRQVDLTRGS